MSRPGLFFQPVGSGPSVLETGLRARFEVGTYEEELKAFFYDSVFLHDKEDKVVDPSFQKCNVKSVTLLTSSGRVFNVVTKGQGGEVKFEQTREKRRPCKTSPALLDGIDPDNVLDSLGVEIAFQLVGGHSDREGWNTNVDIFKDFLVQGLNNKLGGKIAEVARNDINVVAEGLISLRVDFLPCIMIWDGEDGDKDEKLRERLQLAQKGLYLVLEEMRRQSPSPQEQGGLVPRLVSSPINIVS